MSRIAYVDGVYQPIDMPGIHVEDRGYQFADGVYEVCAVHNARPVDEEAHLDRLERSLGELGIAAPMSHAAMKIVVRETLARNRIRNGIVYIQVTRGVASREHNYPAGLKPVLVVTARHTDPTRRASVLRDGISVVTVPDQRWARCDIKSISLLPNVLARQAAKDRGVQEAWQVDADGMVTEGAATNAWIVDNAGVLRTRPADGGILNGIVRQTIIGLLDELGLTFEERSFSVEEALLARECFSTASTLAVFPVVNIDGQNIGDGKPGAVARQIVNRYD
ncbi:MAG: D-amino-acid transaminase, partial [Pseudomonadota bacterium]|nr:D-amino-acid transaminase [Pseudomonadota bacterium]